ncbi:MAG: bifunctional nuclease family protein [Spirochaetales bacterium]|jgi:uncharacterized protein|nr:bifunctional nuclease family protein [Spirochaetales bacterium]
MLVEAEIWSIARIGQDNAVLIKPVGSERAVPIYIDQIQTQSILIGLGNVPIPRPLTHDLIINLLKNLSVQIERVEITSVKDGTFYAQIVLKKGGGNVLVDSRPSDAIALAVRIKCPIFISETVVEEAATDISEITGETVEDIGSLAGSGEPSEKASLEDKLQQAVDDENYELAALIRDRLQELGES